VISCGSGPLASGATRTCVSKTITVVAGQTTSGVNVSGTDPLGQLVGDSDPAHHFGAQAAVRLVKSTNGHDANSRPGPAVTPGSTIAWTYVVTNTGNVTLKNLAVADSDAALTVTCPATELVAGASMTCQATGTAISGQYDNTGTVVGTPVAADGAPIPGMLPVTDDDPSHYIGAAPAITLVKTTNNVDANSAPGPYLVPGSSVVWRYLVTNTGNVPLAPVYVVDDRGVSVACPKAALLPNQSTTCIGSGTAQTGQYANVGTAYGQPADFDLEPLVGFGEISASDPSHYFGAVTGVSLVKSTNGADADLAPGVYVRTGDAVAWTYDVTNTGNVALSPVTVTDDRGVAVTCPAMSLAAGATMRCTGSGSTTTGQYTNVGKVTGTPAQTDGVAIGGPFPAVTATEPSNYFGVDARLELVKYTLGTDNDESTGPFVPVGATVTWTYVVHNTGNVKLDPVVVTDDRGVVVTCPTTALAVGALMTCSGTGAATAGQYTNLGTAVGRAVEADGDAIVDPATGAQFSATDDNPDHYFGARPAITVVKKVNGADANAAPGIYLTVGSAIVWTYEVTNTGNVPLDTVGVTDDRGVTVTCPVSRLAVAATTTCTGSGTAVAAHYVNVGKASGRPVDTAGVPISDPTSGTPMAPVTATDPAHYTGDVPAMTITKQVCNRGTGCASDTAADWTEMYVSPGSEMVQWRIVVTNTGNSPLHDVIVTDPVATSCAAARELSLMPTELFVYTCIASVATVDVVNVATVTAVSPTGIEIRDDDDAKVDVNPADILVSVRVDNPAPSRGDTVCYAIDASNIGGLPATSVVVSNEVPVGLRYVTGSSNPPALYDAGTTSLTWAVGRLEPSALVTVTFCTVVTSADFGSLLNNVAISGNEVETTVGNNRATAEVVVKPDRGVALPETGSDLRALLTAATALVVVGAAVYARARRRTAKR
jgi:uncharacterized repeat protein (TIGR01451 family)